MKRRDAFYILLLAILLSPVLITVFVNGAELFFNILRFLLAQDLTFYLWWYWNLGLALIVFTLCGIKRGIRVDLNEIAARQLALLVKMDKTLNSIEQALRPGTSATGVGIYVTINGFKQKVDHMVLAGAESHALSLEIVDSLGNPAKVDGAPAWSLTDASLASLEVAEDGMSAKLASNGALGAFKVQVTADADLGEGVKAILAEAEFEVISGEAVAMKIVVA